MHYPKVLERVDSPEQIFHRRFSLGAPDESCLCRLKTAEGNCYVIILFRWTNITTFQQWCDIRPFDEETTKIKELTRNSTV